MALLLDFPDLPSQERIVSLYENFSTTLNTHIFLNQFPLGQSCSDVTTPPLRLAVACLASMHARPPDNESRHLFLAALDLWAFMTEVDNREARSLDMLMAVSYRDPKTSTDFHLICYTPLSQIIILSLFGVMTSDSAIDGKLGVMICSSLTVSVPSQLSQRRFVDSGQISRRMRLHDPEQTHSHKQLPSLLGSRISTHR